MIVSVYIATTLDGFIAREGGALDWLPGSDGTVQEGLENEDFGYQSFMDSVDTLVMGRNTFDLVNGFGEWPYADKHVVVLSQTLTQLPDELPESVTLKNMHPEALHEELKANGSEHIYVDGGKTIQKFLAAGLIDEITITTVPILIGKGIPLFNELTHDIKLQLINIQTFKNGFVQSKYKIVT